MASKRGNTNMVQLLLDRGAKIDAKTRVSSFIVVDVVGIWPGIFQLHI